MKSDMLTSTFMRFRATLESVAARIAGPDNAEDVIHDAFCRLWSKHPCIRDESEAIKLTYTAVKNLAIDRYRADGGKQTLPIDQCPEPQAETDEALVADERQQTYEAVLRLSRKTLNETQYKIFRLHDIEEVSYPEIARLTGMSPENVRMTLSRARKALRERYRETTKN